jgi:hypothetical protein
MSEHSESHHHKIRIHIDRKPYESVSPTSGKALYALAGVVATKQLFREAHGNTEDKAIPDNDLVLHLTEDEHFYSEERKSETFSIIVNAEKKVVTGENLTFAALLALAFATPPSGVNVLFTVTYRNGPSTNPEGSMVAGTSVNLKNGMIFNVRATDKS